MNRNVKLEFITPLFSHGATDAPEMRAPSIRGQLHWWFRLLGGTVEQERAVFGGIKQRRATFDGHDKTLASRLVVRVAAGSGMDRAFPTLPHKSNYDSSRRAFAPGSSCLVSMTDRLGGLGENDRLAEDALNAWLLMGTLGFRSTRAGGSFSWEDAAFPQPTDPQAYEDACRGLLDDYQASAKVAVLSTDYDAAEKARRVVSDSLGGRSAPPGETNDLARLHDPLGKIMGGRKTSPLRYRIVKFASGYRILAFWDGRRAVTGNSIDDFYGIVDLLAERKPELGRQLKAAFD